jgi:hypothetical protein
MQPVSELPLLSLTFLLDKWNVRLEMSAVLVLVLVLVGLFTGWTMRRRFGRFKVTKLDIELGKIGKVELKPSIDDIQMAHKIWTQLVTRKAAIPIDPAHDVIVEVYDSWYALFTQVRELIASIPAELVREEQSTKELVRIATATLNDGLRPHLTRWQARFRAWYDANTDQLKTISPQELQAKYPDFLPLVEDMALINRQMITYAGELKRLIDGKDA